jgi:hypothetical protein
LSTFYLETGGWKEYTLYDRLTYNIRVKQYRNRPGVAQRVPGALGSEISMTFGT